MSFSLSKTVVSPEGEQLYTFEYAASAAKTSVTVVQIYIQLGVIEPIGSMPQWCSIWLRKLPN
jgi:hypothetical protein